MSQSLKLPYLWLSQEDLRTELRQLQDEGKDTAAVEGDFARLAGTDLQDLAHQAAAQGLLERAAALPARPGRQWVEPGDLEGIRAERAGPVALEAYAGPEEELLDKVHGAWLGRACGCLLGKPVEGWRRCRIDGYLKDTGRWPLSQYFTRNVPAELAERYDVRPRPAGAFLEDVTDGMPEDDDLNYTVLGLLVMERHGPGFTSADVARAWMTHLPILRTYTAERAAYRNLAGGVPPPGSARFRNPYREWIGAQIRADLFGYAAPGQGERAAEWAWRDARVSHVANGIYGEMWVAAMLAAAFVTDDVERILRAGLGQVPARSRLRQTVGQVLQWHADGLDYDRAADRIHQQWDEAAKHDWCHVLSNAAIVAVGLLWGGRQLGPSICRAVQCGFDTDCNGATVGSVLGAVRGAGALPREWTGPLGDTLHTGLAGHGRLSIRNLAERTVRLARAGGT